MRSPARAHFIRMQAAAAAPADARFDALRPDLNQYELHLAQLAEHKRALKRVQSLADRAKLKAQYLPDYAPYVEGVLKADSGRGDDVLTTVMVWRIDAGDFWGALNIADYVLRHKLELPDQYKRTPATLIAEEIAEKAQVAEDPADIATMLLSTLALVEGHDMPDEVRAKLEKATGRALAAQGDAAGAVAHYQVALARNPHVGVKKDIERLQRQLAKQQEGA